MGCCCSKDTTQAPPAPQNEKSLANVVSESTIPASVPASPPRSPKNAHSPLHPPGPPSPGSQEGPSSPRTYSDNKLLFSEPRDLIKLVEADDSDDEVPLDEFIQKGGSFSFARASMGEEVISVMHVPVPGPEESGQAVPAPAEAVDTQTVSKSPEETAAVGLAPVELLVPEVTPTPAPVVVPEATPGAEAEEVPAAVPSPASVPVAEVPEAEAEKLIEGVPVSAAAPVGPPAPGAEEAAAAGVQEEAVPAPAVVPEEVLREEEVPAALPAVVLEDMTEVQVEVLTQEASAAVTVEIPDVDAAEIVAPVPATPAAEEVTEQEVTEEPDAEQVPAARADSPPASAVSDALAPAPAAPTAADSAPAAQAPADAHAPASGPDAPVRAAAESPAPPSPMSDDTSPPSSPMTLPTPSASSSTTDEVQAPPTTPTNKKRFSLSIPLVEVSSLRQRSASGGTPKEVELFSSPVEDAEHSSPAHLQEDIVCSVPFGEEVVPVQSTPVRGVQEEEAFADTLSTPQPLNDADKEAKEEAKDEGKEEKEESTVQQRVKFFSNALRSNSTVRPCPPLPLMPRTHGHRLNRNATRAGCFLHGPIHWR